MRTTIVKWGNSQGIRLPKAFLQNIQLAENDPVEVLLEEDKIIIKKIKTSAHKTIQQRLDDFYKEKIVQNDTPQDFVYDGAQSAAPYVAEGSLSKEINWGKPVGNEVW